MDLLGKISKLAMAAAALVAVAACHKDKGDDDSSYTYFSGVLAFDCPSFMGVGDGDYTLIPNGAYRKDGGDYGYYWTASPIQTARDTTRRIGDPSSADGRFVFSVPDTMCTVTLLCGIFADEYYTSTATKQVVIVKPDSSLRIDAFTAGPDGTFTDTRDGQKYEYRSIGGYDWFMRNLSWAGAGKPFDNASCMEPIFGGYYTWNEAKTVCPEGWTLPDSTAWNALALAAGAKKADGLSTYEGIAGSMMANCYFNGDRMWEYWPAVKITNATGFSAIPSGYGNKAEDLATFYDVDYYSAFWTADENDGLGLYRYLYVQKPDVYVGNGHKDTFMANVRCVRKSH